jgi:hypothetical protein
LVSAGHSLSVIGDYTLQQIQLFSAAEADQRKDAGRLGLIVARAANAEDKSFKKIFQEFES